MSALRALHPATKRTPPDQDQGMWLGYLQEFPDYMTQGETLEELQENLRDLYIDLTRVEIPG